MRTFCAPHFVSLTKVFYVVFLRQPQIQRPPPVSILRFIKCAHMLFCKPQVSMGITTGSRSWPNFLFGSWPKTGHEPILFFGHDRFFGQDRKIKMGHDPDCGHDPKKKMGHDRFGSWPRLGSLTPNTNRSLQNEWLILYVVMVFIFSSLKSGGMGNFFCLECFSKEKPAAMLV